MAKIMVIDDDSYIRLILIRILSRRGHQVIPVSDGAFAMKEIRGQEPDIIILDILMPGLDGFSLGHHLKFKSEFSNTPVVIITSLVDKAYLAKEISADGFISKPFDGDKVIEIIEDILAKKMVSNVIPPKSRIAARGLLSRLFCAETGALTSLILAAAASTALKL